ncbi:MAG: family 16 glycosylhydrolase [Bacteroidota bacterium]
MASLKFMLGLIPDTNKIEAEEKALREEFEEFNKYSKSDELKNFEELDQFINSKDFVEIQNDIKSQKFKDTEAYSKLQEYNTLKKLKEMKDFFKAKKSKQLTNLEAIEESDLLSRFKELEEYVNSGAVDKAKASMKSKAFKKSEEYIKWKEYKQLKSNKRLKDYFKFKESSVYQNYKKIEGSDKLQRYKELEDFVNSEEFKNVKAYMALSPKKKFQQSDEFRKQQEYLKLKKSDKIKWYFKALKEDKFKELKNWNIIFFDDFTGVKLSGKWITKYYWGEELLKDSYSMAFDKHFVTDGKNLKVDGSVLKIETRQEKVSGKAWNPMFGFMPQEFEYTSGLISTGNSFRHKHGRIQAKIRLNQPGDVTHAFWLVGEKLLPQVDIFKTVGSKLLMSVHWGDITQKNGALKKTSSAGSGKVMKDFYIFELEWNANELTWKVNGLTLANQTTNIPDEPMYMVLSSGVYKDKISKGVPATMEVDWVRWMERTEE